MQAAQLPEYWSTPTLGHFLFVGMHISAIIHISEVYVYGLTV